MKSAALIFGLLAGIAGAAAIALGNLAAGLAALPWLDSDLLARVVLYSIIALGLLGAGLALIRPKVGGVLMLLSALAWLGAGVLAGHGAVLFASLPFTFVAAGALVGLFARRREPSRELAVRNRPRDWEDEEEDGPAYAPAPRGLRDRSSRDEPAVQAPSPRRPSRAPEPVAFVDVPEEETEEEEDYVDAEEADYEDVEEQGFDGAAEDEHDEDVEPVVETPPTRPQPTRARQGGWSLPEPEQTPAPRRARERYVPERQDAPVRRQPVPPGRRPAPPPPPAEDDFDLDDQDFAPPRRDFQERPRNAYREFEPYEGREREPRRESPLRGLLRILVLLVFVLVVAGIAVAIYLDYERGPNSLLFGSHQSAASSSTTPAVKPVTPAPAAKPSADTTAPADSTTSAPSTDTSFNTPAPVTSATTPVAPTPLAPAPTPAASTPATPAPSATTTVAGATVPAPQGQTATYADPVAYCKAIGTVDAPDEQYSGPAVPKSISVALGLQSGAATDQVHWRCADQNVMACNANHGAACNLTPTVDMMLSYCADHPDAKNLQAPNGSWSCNGKRPIIPRDQKWPVDARGFFPGAWQQVQGG